MLKAISPLIPAFSLEGEKELRAKALFI